VWKSRGASANPKARLMKANPNNRLLALALAALALCLSAIQRTEAATWTTNIPLLTARYGHTATLLPNGKVLVAGGYGTNFNYVSSAELYDQATGKSTVTGTPGAPRGFHTATLLLNGKVLVTGGCNSTDGFLSSAELYDPGTGTWTPTGAMATGREYHTATLLPNGMVLIVGGENGHVVGQSSLDTVELYDPGIGKWTAAGRLQFARYQHTATMLTNGQVLIAGGYGNLGFPTTAELYDPVSGTWTNTGALLSSS